MGVLSQIRQQSQATRRATQQTALPVAAPVAQPEPAPPPSDVSGNCPRCQNSQFWRDGYGQLHCATCRPPVTPAMVREMVAAGRRPLPPLPPIPKSLRHLPVAAVVDFRDTHFGGVWREFVMDDGRRRMVRADVEVGDLELGLAESWGTPYLPGSARGHSAFWTKDQKR